MEFLQCNCLTKTPDPQFHKENCPIWMAHKIKQIQLEALKIGARFELFKMSANQVCKSIEYHTYVTGNKEIEDEYDGMMKPIWQEFQAGIDANPPLIAVIE